MVLKHDITKNRSGPKVNVT